MEREVKMKLVTHPRSKEYNALMNKRRSPTYNSWRNMKSRVMNPRHHNYKYWGERGIIVCERWLSFQNFLEDMGERPEGTTLDRIDPNGNYEPGNCRWANHSEQRNNRRVK